MKHYPPLLRRKKIILIGDKIPKILFFNHLFAQNTVTDTDGNTYPTVNIREREWMAENLQVTHHRNGDPLHHSDAHQFWQSTEEGIYTWC